MQYATSLYPYILILCLLIHYCLCFLGSESIRNPRRRPIWVLEAIRKNDSGRDTAETVEEAKPQSTPIHSKPQGEPTPFEP